MWYQLDFKALSLAFRNNMAWPAFVSYKVLFFPGFFCYLHQGGFVFHVVDCLAFRRRRVRNNPLNSGAESFARNALPDIVNSWHSINMSPLPGITSASVIAIQTEWIYLSNLCRTGFWVSTTKIKNKTVFPFVTNKREDCFVCFFLPEP